MTMVIQLGVPRCTVAHSAPPAPISTTMDNSWRASGAHASAEVNRLVAPSSSVVGGYSLW